MTEHPDPLDIPLPAEVRLPGAVFGKGVSLLIFIGAARRWKALADEAARRDLPEPRTCPKCGASVGLLGCCAAPGCPCPLLKLDQPG